MGNNTSSSYSFLRESFQNIRPECKLKAFLKLGFETSDEDIVRSVANYAEYGIGLISPVIDADDFEWLHPDRLLRIYGVLLQSAQENGIRIALNLERFIEEAFVKSLNDADCVRLKSRVLLHHEYYCNYEEPVKMKIQPDMAAIVALEENGKTDDLRSFVKDGVLEWKAPRGNWNICQYICREDSEQNRINVLDYDAVKEYISAVLGLFKSDATLSVTVGKTLGALACSDICFMARNRRNWDKGFDKKFIKKYGYNPEPYYPMLYDCPGAETAHYKAQLMDCRADMLRDGVMRALADTALENGLQLFAGISEPKISACSWVTGDAMQAQIFSPCAVLEKAYLYGMNSLMIAAGAAYGNDKEIIACEIFRDYNKTTTDMVYRETITAFSRGINELLAHFPLSAQVGKSEKLFTIVERIEEQCYSEYVGRIQSVLRGGTHICDIALLYPIYALHSSVCLYDTPASRRKFEYPDTPDTIDYMTVINSISSYSGLDLTVLHPETLKDRCHAESGRMILENKQGNECYRIMVIPAAELISLENLEKLAEFYDGGGKILATGVLPKKALEFTPNKNHDSEVAAIIRHIFGDGAVDDNICCDYIYNSNENGGEACFLYSTTTGADRTYLVSGARLYEAIFSFNIPFDVILEDMPRMECTGALNNSYPEYEVLGLSATVRGGGMLNHIHKQYDGVDVYYFSNATDIAYENSVLIRGLHRFEEWNPRSGKIRRVKSTYLHRGGVPYTRTKLKLDSAQSLFFVSVTPKTFVPTAFEDEN